MEGNGATCVFLHSKDTSPRLCPSTVWVTQAEPTHVDTSVRLHAIDLCGKVDKNWREVHAAYIEEWDTRQQRVCHAPPQISEMPRNHAYYCWYCLITRKYVNRNSARLDILIESHLVLLKLLLVGSPGHMHVLDVLKAVDELGRVAAANGQANNAHETESVVTASPSTSAAPLITPSRG